jgi:hypothetical protein
MDTTATWTTTYVILLYAFALPSGNLTPFRQDFTWRMAEFLAPMTNFQFNLCALVAAGRPAPLRSKPPFFIRVIRAIRGSIPFAGGVSRAATLRLCVKKGRREGECVSNE